MLLRIVLPLMALASFTFAMLQMAKANKPDPVVTPPVEPAKTPYVSSLAGAGLVEPETENINIGTPLPGVVARVHVVAGQTVKPGDLLFNLDDRQLLAERQARLANLHSAEKSLRKLQQLPRPEEVPPLEAKVEEAKANLEEAITMFERLKRVSVGASEEEMNRREMAVKVARAQLSRALADLNLLNKGAWEADLAMARAAVEMAKAQLDQTTTDLDRICVRAPYLKWNDSVTPPQPLQDTSEFKVLQVNVRPGEYVGAQPGTPLIVLGYVGKLHVRVDIDENEIARFRPGLPGTAKPRGNPNQEFPLKFVRVEPYVIPKRSLTGGNTERVDTRVLQVIYAIEPGPHALYVGQQMDVFLNVTEP